MKDHPTGGECGDGATARLRNSKQRQKRQLDSRERPAICRTAWLRVREKKPDMKVRFPLRHHRVYAWAFSFSRGRIGKTPVRLWGQKKGTNEMNELDLDKFGEIMDDFLKKNEIRMLVTLPEGSIEPVVEDNVGLGSTVHFYILLNSIATVCQQMQKDMGIDKSSAGWANVVHELLKMVEAELLEVDTAR